MNAVTMAVTGALGGQTDLQVVANTLAPYAAQVIGGQFGHGEDKNTAAQLASHAILGAALAYVNGGDPTAGGSAAVASEAAADYLTNQYKDNPAYQNESGEFIPNLLPEYVKTQIRDLTAAIGAVVGGTVGDSAFEAQLAGVVGQNAVENNVLSPEEYKRKVELINKAQGGANGLNFKVFTILNNGSLNENEAREFLALVAMDKYSDQLLKQYVKNPKSLSNEQLYDLTYLLNQASNGDSKKAQQIYSDAKFNIGTADPYTGEQLNQAIIKAKQSLSYANSTDKQLAEAAGPALFGLTGKLGTVIRYVGGLAGSYNVGQGSAKIADGKYSEGAVQVVNGALMIAPVLTEAKYVLGRLEGAGAVKGANFAQSRIRADQSFSAEGKANYSKLAGYPINTIDDLALAIQKGKIKVSQLPVDYVELKSGQKLILNTRTSTALNRAGVSQDKWYGNNQTGIQVPEMKIGTTFDKLAQDQLKRNKLPETGSKTITRK